MTKVVSEHIKTYYKKWRIEHREHSNRYMREYYRTHKNKMKEASSRWVSKNRDKVRAKERRYVLKDPVRYAQMHRIRNIRYQSSTGTLSYEVAQQVYEENIKKFGTLTCELCFGSVKFGQDCIEHFHPVSRREEYTGKDINERSNLGVAHGSNSPEKCNNKKATMTLKEWFDRKRDR